MNIVRTSAAALLTAGLAGCAGGVPSAAPSPASSASRATPASSAPVMPTDAGRPSGIPKTPTDIVRTAGVLFGTVTRGGSGPCYGITDWDGVQYAVYSDAGLELAEGTRVRADVRPATLRINCGEGKPMQASTLEKAP